MAQEVGTEDGMFHVGNNERPFEGPTESQVEGEGAHTINRYWGQVSSLQRGPCGERGTTTTGGRYDAHLGTCVHKDAQVIGPVRDKKEATRWLAFRAGRRQHEACPFPFQEQGEVHFLALLPNR